MKTLIKLEQVLKEFEEAMDGFNGKDERIS